MSDFGFIAAVVLLGIFILLAIGIVWAIVSDRNAVKKYMEKQRVTGEDKERMMQFSHMVFGEKYQNYTYVLASNIRIIKKGDTVTHYNQSYIVAFNETEMQIVSYIVKSGQILCRNVLPVDFGNMEMTYKITKESVALYFRLGGEKMPMGADRVMVSSGDEESAIPLGIYQETEVDRLASLLPNYPKKN